MSCRINNKFCKKLYIKQKAGFLFLLCKKCTKVCTLFVFCYFFDVFKRNWIGDILGLMVWVVVVGFVVMMDCVHRT